MNLTKKNARRLKAIQKALASGKGLGGLLVGLAAATVATGCNVRIPFFRTAGKPANFHNEVPDMFVTEGEVPELPEPPEPAATNAVNEADDKRSDSLPAEEIGKVPAANTNAVNESRDRTLMRTSGLTPLQLPRQAK